MIDAIELQILVGALRAICEEMGAVLIRSAHSANIKERRDASTALFDSRGQMVMQAEHIPVHLGAMPAAVAAVLDRDHAPGRSWILNDPYRGGTHLPDITVITPVFAGGELIAFAANRAHHADVGGPTPGSMPADSRTLSDEGVVIEPRVIDHESISELVAQMRQPAQRRADLQAQLASGRAGVRRLVELIERTGLDTVLEAFGEVLDYASQVGNEVVRILDADRDPNQRVGDPKPIAGFFGNPGMGRARRMRHQGFGAAEADREFDDLQRIEQPKRFRFAALDREAEGRAGARALSVEHVSIAASRFEKSEVVDGGDLVVRPQEARDQGRVHGGPVHAQRHRLHRPHDHPRGVRVELRAERAAQFLDRSHHLARADDAAGDQIGMPADILGQRIHHDIGAVGERPLEHGPEEGVVDRDRRPPARLFAADALGDLAHELQVDEAVGRIGRRFEEHQADASAARSRHLERASRGRR